MTIATIGILLFVGVPLLLMLATAVRLGFQDAAVTATEPDDRTNAYARLGPPR